jgi:hypothetical protein
MVNIPHNSISKKGKKSQPLVTHSCNASYSGGRDQEDRSSKTTWADSSWDPISKKTLHKRAGGVTQCVGPEFKSQYR